MSRRIVVVGGGHGGVQLCDSLRAAKIPAEIILVNDEEGWPYQRPPLSKEFLKGDEISILPLRGEQFYESRDIRLISGHAATDIDPLSKTVKLEGGQSLAYDDLVMALGASNRKLNVPGEELRGVAGLRTAKDATALYTALEGVKRVVIVGAGFVGLEFASAASSRGIEVTVVDIADRAMSRVLSPGMSQRFDAMHREQGVRFLYGEGVRQIVGINGSASAVETTAGTEIETDLVLVSVGAAPNMELARKAGLEVGNGIIVDGRLRTSDKNIWAIGDCVSFPSFHAGRWVRLESVQNATDQARHLAYVLAGSVEHYRELPWFWTIQGDYRLQIAGIYESGDQEVIYGEQENKYSVLCFRRGMLVAVESLNSPGDHVAARKILGLGGRLSYDVATASGFDLKSYSKSTLKK